MSTLQSSTTPEIRNYLISFADLSNFVSIMRKSDTKAVYDFVREFAEKVGEVIEPAEGKLINIHFGEAVLGIIGTKTDPRLDIIGRSVNTAALIPSHGIALTPQVFRKLSAEVRKLFKKHTPPIIYIGAEERHKD